MAQDGNGTAGKVIECRAAVAWEPAKPLTIETVQVQPPKSGEVRIRIVSTGVCHTDAYTLSGKDPEGLFPCILGHEGAGVIESVGAGVDELKPGDHVIPLYVPQCRNCEYCVHPSTNLCQAIRVTQGRGVMPDGTTRFSVIKDGKSVALYHFMGCSAFCEYTVLPEIAVAKVHVEAPLNTIGLLGCGISTGYGAAWNTAKVHQGSKCVIFGLGGVGLAVAAACQQRLAGQIIGVDLNEEKFELARKFGVTQFINASKLQENESLVDAILKATDGGADYTFECIGNVQVMRAALESAHKGWGVSVIIGVAPSGAEISTRPFQLVTGRTWKGTAFGGWKSRDSVPLLVKAYLDNVIKVDQFVTARLPLDQINEAFRLMHASQTIRTMIDF